MSNAVQNFWIQMEKDHLYFHTAAPHFLRFHLTAKAKENFTISYYVTLVSSEIQKCRFLGCFSPALFQPSHPVSIKHF